MTEPKPMNPERLADLREGLVWNSGNPDAPHVPTKLVVELLADRDHWEAEAKLANDTTALGHVVREKRIAAGLTLRDLASTSGLSTDDLGLVERGVWVPRALKLATIFSAIATADGPPRP